MSTVAELTPEQTLQKQSFPGSALTEPLAFAEQLTGKVVVCTGAGNGFGRSYSLLAAAHGAKVVLSDVNVAAVDEVLQEIKAAGGEAIATRCNVADWDSQVAMFRLAIDTFGVVDVVVANAGVTEIPGWFDDTEGEDGEPKKPNMLTVDVNLVGVSYTARLAFHHLKKNPSTGLKSLVLLGSMSSFFGIPMAPMYSMSKHAILGLFRSLFWHSTEPGINVNIVCPWFSSTGILSAPTRIAVAGLPLAEVDDVVGAIFKASSDPSFSGNILAVDAAGILCIDTDTFVAGDGGYYKAFFNRAIYAVSTVKTIKDVVTAVGGPSASKNAVKTIGLGALALGVYGAGGMSEMSIAGMVASGVAVAGSMAA